MLHSNGVAPGERVQHTAMMQTTVWLVATLWLMMFVSFINWLNLLFGVNGTFHFNVNRNGRSVEMNGSIKNLIQYLNVCRLKSVNLCVL